MLPSISLEMDFDYKSNAMNKTQMSGRSIILVTTAGLALAGVLAAPMDARKSKKQQPTPQLDSQNLFSNPQAEQNALPTFVSGNGRPLAASRSMRPVDFKMIRELPSLTQPQREQVSRLDRRLNKQIGALNSSIGILQQKLNPQPPEVQASPAEQSALKSDIAELKHGIADARQDAYEDLFQLLTYKQWQDYEKMKHGDLTIEQSPSANTSQRGGK
ncbi:MAG TPA: hypothetical protein V6D22_23305 [Candidatus Obscuribacterales bacterium]